MNVNRISEDIMGTLHTTFSLVRGYVTNLRREVTAAKRTETLLHALLCHPKTLRIEIQRVHKAKDKLALIKEVQVLIRGIKPEDTFAVVADTMPEAIHKIHAERIVRDGKGSSE